MADWRKLAMAAILADGKIDETEVKILKKEFFADGAIDDDEITFLLELRDAAQKKAKAKKEEAGPQFDAFFFAALKKNVVQDGKIDAKEAGWLRTTIFADGKVDDGEWNFLQSLKKAAKSTAKEFDDLYTECEQKVKKAQAKAAKKA